MADDRASYKVVVDGTTPSVTPGTAVQLNGGTSQGCRSVLVTALAENKGAIAVGGSTVKATAGAGRGVQLAPGQTYEFRVQNVNLLYIDALNAGDAVSWLVLHLTD